MLTVDGGTPRNLPAEVAGFPFGATLPDIVKLCPDATIDSGDKSRVFCMTPPSPPAIRAPATPIILLMKSGATVGMVFAVHDPHSAMKQLVLKYGSPPKRADDGNGWIWFPKAGGMVFFRRTPEGSLYRGGWTVLYATTAAAEAWGKSF